MGEGIEIEKEIREVSEKEAIELMKEFCNHYEEHIKERPEDINRKEEIYQSWSIQKIAGIHIVILKLVEKINTLSETVRYYHK